MLLYHIRGLLIRCMQLTWLGSSCACNICSFKTMEKVWYFWANDTTMCNKHSKLIFLNFTIISFYQSALWALFVMLNNRNEGNCKKCFTKKITRYKSCDETKSVKLSLYAKEFHTTIYWRQRSKKKQPFPYSVSKLICKHS